MGTAFNFSGTQSNSMSKYLQSIIYKCIIPAFQSLALSYSITPSQFYDTVHECEFSYVSLLSSCPDPDKDPNKFEPAQWFDREGQVNRSSKKLHRLIGRLRLASTDPPDCRDAERGSYFFTPKIFDVALNSAVCAAYNDVAIKYNFSNATEENVLPLPRNAFSVPEYMALSCLYLSVHSQSLFLLNEMYTSAKQKYKAKQRFRNIADTLFSPSFRCAVIRTFLDHIYFFVATKSNAILETYIREFLVQPEYRNLKYTEYAFQKHGTDELIFPDVSFICKQICSDMLGKELVAGLSTEELVYRLSAALGINNQTVFDCSLDYIWAQFCDLNIYNSFCDTICVIAELIAFGHLPTYEAVACEVSSEIKLLPLLSTSSPSSDITLSLESEEERSISSEEYHAASILASVLNDYFCSTQREVSRLLKLLPESEVAGKQDFFEFLQNLHK